MKRLEGAETMVAGAQAARLAGYFLVLAFFGLGGPSVGLRITFHRYADDEFAW